MKCSYCKNDAIYHNQKYYCKEHFINYFETKVKATIKNYKLLSKSDKIVVACSGGKDSTIALYLMNKLYPHVEAIAIDEGIKGYRKKTLDWLKAYCTDNNIKLNIYSFEEEFGFALDSVNPKQRLCMSCGVLRRYLLNSKSRGHDKLVTGHNLDDEAQSIFMDMAKANFEALIRLGPSSGVGKNRLFVPRVKPLYMCTEKEDTIYAHLLGLDVPFIECPYAGFAFRGLIRDKLNEFELENPGAKQNLVVNFLKMLPQLRKRDYNKERIARCCICGEPSRGSICTACILVKKYKKQ